MNNSNLAESDVRLLNSIGIDVIKPDRQYWFVRTDGGDYFDDFYLSGYVGIQWNDVQVNQGSTIESLEESVRDAYTDETRPGYVASQIYKFAFEFKKGDIVLIPNKGSKYIAFGEILDDSMYIEDDTSSKDFSDILADIEESSRLVYQKRRKVRWIKTTPRAKLDPYLKSFIYAHNTIVDLNSYALFIDRSLSDFYIKNDLCYFSLRVNRKENIPYGKMLRFLQTNQMIAEYMNAFMKSYTSKYGDISLDDFSIKINVQSEGPVQIVGPMKKALAFGLVVTALMGGSVRLKLVGQEFELESEGIVPVIQEVRNWIDAGSPQDEAEKAAVSEIKDAIEETANDLELSAPSFDD